MKKTLTLLLAATTLAGCATPKQYTAVGGSKADGTVELAFDVGALEDPQPDENQGLRLAQERCKNWGYTSAEAFGGRKVDCLERSDLGSCNAARVTKQYQCLGDSSKQ